MPVTKEDLKDNPFVKLFPSLDDAWKYAIEYEKLNRPNQPESSKNLNDNGIPKDKERINEYIECIFGISFNKDTVNPAVLLDNFATDFQQVWIDMNILEQALFERLLLEDPMEKFINQKDVQNVHHFLQPEPITYLYDSYDKIYTILSTRKSSNNLELTQMQNLVLRNVATALKQPDLYIGQNVPQQFLELFTRSESEVFQAFFNQLIKEIIGDEIDTESTVLTTLLSTLDLVREKVMASTLGCLCQNIFGFINIMAKSEITACVLMAHSTPEANALGISYGETLIGGLLCISCIPKRSSDPVDFYDRPQEAVNAQGIVWSNLDAFQIAVCSVFRSVLHAGPNAKSRALLWLRRALQANASRGQLSNMHASIPATDVVAHSFMLNLTAVLLELCEPFIKNDNKLLRVDLRYCAATRSGFERETCLLPGDEFRKEYDQQMAEKEINFITECFFLTHRAIDLGFRVCADELVSLNQDYERTERAHRDALQSAGVQNEVSELIQRRLTAVLRQLLALRAALLQPRINVQLVAPLFVATSRLLGHAIAVGDTSYEKVVPKTLMSIKYPIECSVSNTFSCIPEFLVENINSWVLFLMRYQPSILEECGWETLDHLLTIFVALMHSDKLVNNPHLRAGLAQNIEALIPKEGDLHVNTRTLLFARHSHRKQIVPALLNVFVSIEMTGREHFEQKFNYRRPIYLVIHYLWTIDEHRERFKALAIEAENNMEAINPPLFLRFINLLMNDAVYLLDEALANMKQIKNMQKMRESDSWRNANIQERHQNEALLTHTGMLAKFENVLGRLTIHTLNLLISEIKSIFTHSTIVDRIAAMLNYFLLHLVGPNMKELKVKDQQEYDFQPRLLVTHICQIYINLQESNEFCLAVSKDGRSYSPQLFVHTQNVLNRIPEGAILSMDMQQVAVRVASEASKQQIQEEMLADAPEEFLDPIMSTLMLDPVILPSSHVTIDRTTIARHLLSDQSDPFSRSPLNMNMIVPAHELRERIHKWIYDREHSALDTVEDKPQDES